MPNAANETIIYFDEPNQSGYVVKLESLEKISGDLKGYKITVKLLVEGGLRSGVLFYEWIPNLKKANEFFDLVVRTIKENLDSLTHLKVWKFGQNPIKFILTHRQ